ncbi:MAG: tail-specific protease [Flavobacteriaceae bacterium]|nr:tail-specific protease [Flavobacteriaceae bacterium]|tara:strand:+ start:8022 stop:10124 length:2103 start_codon:yes stop_codon:yes gene_type:complete
MSLRFSLIITILSLAIFGFTLKKNKLNDPEKEKVLLEIVKYVVERGHYNSIDLDDNFSVKIFDDFISKLDPQKRFFTVNDIRQLNRYKYKIDDQIKNYQLEFFEETYKTYNQRVIDAKLFVDKVFETDFDFSKNEFIDLNNDSIPFSFGKNQLFERWRKQIKYSVLDIVTQRYSSDSLDFNEIKINAISTVKKNTNDFFDYANELDRDDWFSVYVNSFVSQFDPHTFYFKPDDKEKFDVSISGKFDGIGARLSKADGNVKIVDVIIGGPVWRDKLLDVGDVILAVGEEDDELVSIYGMKLDDSIKLIKGPAGTVVTLRVKKIDGQIQDVKIKRDEVELEETFAKSTLISKNDNNYGYISLPKFYADFDNYKNRNSANDVKNEIIKLKNNGIQGLILDLRNNGGGSLQTVVEMTGLFIEKGPVVQVKSIGNRKKVLYDRDPQVYWDGPLVLLINEMSASASEIISAALQDYNRAIIIGSEKSFGKGTVQNIIDLNRFISNTDYDMGALKVTTDIFYRINGESVQLEGVQSDIIIPDSYMYIFNGERDEKNPIKWDKIGPATYTKWNKYSDKFNYVKDQINKKLDQNKLINNIYDRAQWIRNQQNLKNVPLNIVEYKKYQKNQKQKASQFDNISKYQNELSFNLLKAEKPFINANRELFEARAKWHESLSKDIFIDQAVNALDLIDNSIKTNYILAVNNKSE